MQLYTFDLFQCITDYSVAALSMEDRCVLVLLSPEVDRSVIVKASLQCASRDEAQESSDSL